MRRASVFSLAGWLILLGISGRLIADDSGRLMLNLPADTNAVIILRVAETLETPLAKREGWLDEHSLQFLPAAGGIPAWVKTLVVGYRVRPSVPEEVWAAAVASTPEEMTVAGIAATHGTKVDTISGLPTILSPRGAQLAQLQPGVLAVRRPAGRMEMGEWIREIQAGSTGPRSELLRRLTGYNGELLLAADLTHAFDPQMVRMHLAEEPSLANDADALDNHVELIESLLGVQLAVTITEEMQAEVRMIFDSPCDGDAGVLSRFFLNVLHQLGAGMEDFDNAAVRTDGDDLVLEGSFSTDSLIRIVSLITASPASEHEMLPPPPAGDATPNNAQPPLAQSTSIGRPMTLSPEERQLRASRRYFNSVNTLLSNLERNNRRATNYAQTAQWHENFARRILELPSRDVDPELLAYGREVAAKLRGLSRSLQGQAVVVNVQQGTLTYDVDFRPGWAAMNVWGGVGFGESSVNVTSNLREVRERQAQAILAGEKERQQIWQMLADSRDQMEQRMQQKFGGKF